MHQAREVSVELDGVSCRYGDTTVVAELDLQVGRGEFFTLLGPSGCGKSTTLRTIAGFTFPSEGSVRISGHDYTYASPNVRPVNYVFQNYALFPHMSVVQNVAYGLRRRGVGKREALLRARKELDRVRMCDFSERLPAQLSGGQQQRVALARALVNRPDVLLLDEPLSAIDSQLRLQLRAELTKLQKQTGITFVFVTHDQVEALSMSDRIGLMGNGSIIQVSTPEEMYRRPNSLETAEFIGHSAIFEGVLQQQPSGTWSFETAHRESIPVPVSCVEAAVKPASDIFHLVVKPEDVVIAGPNAAASGLEAVVVGRQYQGSDIAFELRLAGDKRIVVTRTIAEDGASPESASVGDRVALMLRDPENLTLL
ncbi:ABC transporter ATP-binding protein [Leucobacter sp. wl10]|uniref:ABC transporter ATP-binding protein n=1 Tax=Leucobacter sp. wl10 TaxID=2304677 RepID=UPI001F09704D|nr:ABC transporter ATP-binding protein [Leucobacter sp. wl10]